MANLRPALEQGCGKQTPSARKFLFSRKSPLRIGSPNASPEVVHRPTSQSPLHFYIRKIQQIRSKKACFDAGKIGFCHCAAVLQTQVPKLCTDLDPSPSLLYILIVGIYSKFARKTHFLVLSVCFLQPCSSAGRRIAASR